MVARHILPALAAAVGLVSAQNNPCTQSEITINSQADITNLATCRTLRGNVLVGTRTDSILNLGQGIQSIDGDLTLVNNGGVTSFSASGLSSISGEFHLQNLTALSTLSFPALTSVGKVNFVSLTALDSLTFTSGIRTARDVVVSDTFLSSLEGLNMVSVASMDINNNRRLVKYESRLGNLTDNLNINANGLNLQVSFPSLIWIANMTISNVSTFDAPALRVVNGSMRFDSNFFRTFQAPNLTSTTSGDISFVSNPQLTNITLLSLTTVGGGFLIANNTALQKVDGFPKLKSVGGAVKLRGNFTNIAFPVLDDVKGAFDVVSTNDIKTSCDKFNQLAPSSQGGGGQIQGSFNCQSNNADANSDTGSGGSGGSSGNGNAAPGMSVNTGAVLGLALVGIFFQAVM